MVEAPDTRASKKTMSSLTLPCVGSPAALLQRSRRLLLSDRRPECRIWRAFVFQSREMRECSVLGNLQLLKFLFPLEYLGERRMQHEMLHFFLTSVQLP